MSPRTGYALFGNEKQEHMDVYVDGKKTTRVIDYYLPHYIDGCFIKNLPYPLLNDGEEVMIESNGDVHIITTREIEKMN